jgi:uncharacterized protein (TIGR02145 family)
VRWVRYRNHEHDICYLILLSSLVAFISCDELEPVNPADPNYALKAPTLTLVSTKSDTEVELAWKDNEEHTLEFVIFRKTHNTLYTEIAQLSNDISSYVDSNCVLGVIYTYAIRSKHESNQSELSAGWTIATVFPPPSNISVIAISDIAVQVSWIDNCSFEQSYRIERDVGAGFVFLEEVYANVTSIADSSFEYGIEHVYRVGAVTANNTSDWGISLGVIVGIPVVTNLEARALNDSQIQLSWVDNSASEDGFKIERDSGGGFIEVAEVKDDTEQFVDSQLQYGQPYKYRVASYKGNDVFGWDTTDNQYTVFPGPSDLTSSATSDSEIEIVWVDNCDFESGYLLERDSGEGFEQLVQFSENITRYQDMSLEYGLDYIYRVAAYSALNTSQWESSSFVNTTILVPTSFSASAISNTEIELTWVDNCNYEEGYTVERDSGTGFSQIVELGANVTSYIDDSVSYGDVYVYRIMCYTTQNQSEYSNEIEPYFWQTLTDIDGNVYETIRIGDQLWMAENLKVTHYSDGSAISGDGNWTNTSAGAYSIYNGDASNEVSTYGALYNWFAATDSRNIAPDGWHVPTDSEWHVLVESLGGAAVAGGKLKEAGTTHWSNPNTGATNESSFTALPGGFRNYYYESGSPYHFMNTSGYFWTDSEDDSLTAWSRSLSKETSEVSSHDAYKRSGYSIRCIKD